MLLALSASQGDVARLHHMTAGENISLTNWYCDCKSESKNVGWVNRSLKLKKGKRFGACPFSCKSKLT
jgi:hypothetical protein